MLEIFFGALVIFVGLPLFVMILLLLLGQILNSIGQIIGTGTNPYKEE